MTQAQFSALDAAIVSSSRHLDIHEAQILAALAVGLAGVLSLTASAALQDLANRAGPYV
jgi:hypothetical protein